MILVSATLYGGVNVEESATVTNAYVLVCGVPKILTKNIQKTRSPCVVMPKSCPEDFQVFAESPTYSGLSSFSGYTLKVITTTIFNLRNPTSAW